MSQFNTPRSWILPLLAWMLVGGGCRSIEPVSLSPTANPIQELGSFAADMESAKGRQIDVLAPSHFSKAEKYMDQAKYRRERNEAGGRILESVAYGRAHLNEAEKTAQKTASELHNVIVARELALTAGARQLSSELSNLDRQLKSAAERLEKDKLVGLETRNRLQQAYLDLELDAIKQQKLAEARNILAVAEKKGARRYTPKSLNHALQKFAMAEKTVETDRHNQGKIDQAAQEAAAAARNMLRILETAHAAKDKPLEEVAMELDSRNVALQEKAQQLQKVATEAMRRQKALGQVRGQVASLEEQGLLEEAYNEALDLFSPDEAEVYRQGNKLIIRLKGVGFETGRADLPAPAIETLTKLKSIVEDVEPENVVIEGHTDSTGSAAINQKLSEKRAETVRKFLTEEGLLPRSRVRTYGMSFQKPLASNKSKEGRMQNRRVDVILEAGPAETVERGTRGRERMRE